MHRLHYDVVSNGVLWFVLHDLFDTRAPTAVRHPLPRGVGRVRRGERGVRRGGRRGRARRRDRARAGLPARARARASCAPAVPTCGSCTSRTRRSAGPTASGCSRPTSPSCSAARWRAARPGSTRTAGPRRTSPATRAVLGDGAAMQPFAAASVPTSTRSMRDGGRTGDAAKRPTRSPTSSATAS